MEEARQHPAVTGASTTSAPDGRGKDGTGPAPSAAASTLVPTLRYADAPAAIAWLCEAFGFARHLVVEDGAGGIAHAQLVHGTGMIMLGSARDDTFGRHMVSPASLGGRQTHSVYVIVADADAHRAQAVARGAAILIEIDDEDYGGRGYTCRDPEGYIWTFGTYDPWAGG